MERRREKLNKSGVSRCWREFGGMSGAEEETKRAVGRRRDGSSASVSVSPAQSWPGAVDIVFNAAVRERRPGVAITVPAAGFGNPPPPRPQEVYMGRWPSSSSFSLLSCGVVVDV